VIGWLIDAAAIVNQLANSKGSYGPYCRALERICYEESFHLKQGHDNSVFLATGTQQQKDMVQDALNRWWKPVIHFFGPPDSQSVHSEKLIKWKVKMMSNDQMRNQFFDMYVPKIREIGLTIPDEELKRNEDGTWNYSDPDWNEFKEVIKGNGPCNKERIAVRRMAEERGRWVRKAILDKNSTYVPPLA
jgi:ring-1,2-phenylacetyl-CoA epoxidase subunit PaaA